ncbi:MAG: helix-turn-helix domain-containing protein [Pseudonocardiaceae bacterium]
MTTHQTITAARKAFGRQLAELRGAANLTQTELAGLVGYSRSTVANIEAGYQSASPEFCRKCDHALSSGGVLRAALEEIEELERELHRRAAASAQQDRRAQIQACQQGHEITRTPTAGPVANGSGGPAASAIRRALATLADHTSGYTEAAGMDNLETCVLNAYQQQGNGNRGPLSVVLVGGFAGSGKREFARFLSSVTGWTILDKHTMTHALVERLLPALGQDSNDRQSAVYLEHVRPFEYRCLMDAMTENLRCGISTVVTAPFVREFTDVDWLTRVRNRCATHRARLSVVWIKCDEESMRDYIAYRGAARDSWKLTNWADYRDTIDPDFEPSFEHYTVDNRLNAAVALADQAREIAAQVQA